MVRQSQTEKNMTEHERAMLQNSERERTRDGVYESMMKEVGW